MPPTSPRPFDVVVFGATSFVGRILCRHMVDEYGIDGELRWAIAGRNPAKLDSVAADTGADVERIVADAADEAALANLAQSTRLVISTVGPYALYGSPLVAAVATAGTDYCDLTGEPIWMRQMIDAHAEVAAASGARIVHSCGFDSIPSDLGVWFTQQRAIEEFGEPCRQIAMRVKAIKGGASGGTIASMMNAIEEMAGDKEVRRIAANPYALAPDGMRKGPRQPDTKRPTNDDASGGWIAPFVMAVINTRIVHRTHALLGRPWGDDFLYDEAMMMGRGPAGAAKAAATTGVLGGVAGLSMMGPTRKLVERVLPKPGEGPSPEKQEAGFFDVRFFGSTADGRTIATKVTGDRDPGYGSTAKMLTESALCLLDTDRGEVAGGFWTPATAMGDALIERLVANAGLTFDVLDAEAAP